MDLDPIRFLRRRERFREEVDQEVEAARHFRAGAAEYLAEKLARTDLTSRYRKILQAAARRLRS